MRQIFQLCLLLFLTSCTTDTTGGSDNPDFMAGLIIDSSGSPLAEAEILLIPDEYNPQSDNPNLIKRFRSDATGIFRCSTEAGKTYTIEAYTADSSLSRVVANIASNADTTIVLYEPTFISLILSESQSTNTEFSLKGTTIYSSVVSTMLNDSQQVATLGPIPSGTYNKLMVTHDTKVATVDSLILSSQDTTMLILDTDSITIKEQWIIPVIIGIQESTMAKYGGMLSIAKLIEQQFQSVNNAFTDERIAGNILFKIDSIYSFQGTLSEENTPLADSVGLRVLYDAHTKSSAGNWNRTTRTIFHDHTENSGDSLFSDASLTQLMFEMGLSRGCYYLSGMEVFADSNSINNSAYEPAPTIMQQRSATLWSALSIELINYYGKKYSIEPDTAKFSSADTIEFTVRTGDNTPVKGATINLYGVKPHSLSVENTPAFTFTNNNLGSWTSTTPLFQGNDRSTQLYSNFLIEVTVSDTKSYDWLPFDEVGAHYHKTKERLYKKVITTTN